MKDAALTATARTHPPRYLLHKYWSRKPYNVVQDFIRDLLPSPGVVVDPFVGSGITAAEAAAQGHEVYACDVNPVSVLLTQVTTHPPAASAFDEAMGAILGALEDETRQLWEHEAETIRYLVHAVVVACPRCGLESSSVRAIRRGRLRRCPGCDAVMRFNLESMTGTAVQAVSLSARDTLNREPSLLRAQQRHSGRWFGGDPTGPLFEPFAANRRILAFPGRRPADLFTPRAASTLLRFRAAVQRLEEPGLRAAGMLMLTASAAQCSRLIAFRDKLRSGGPAWSVPGFWVPPLHLETNPIIHLRARARRFSKGLRDLQAQPRAGSVQVQRGSAPAFLEGLHRRGVRADLVILDPPYGDSVPFVEFSTFWNALLGERGDPTQDISVSDRQPQADAWMVYREQLRRTFAAVAALLTEGGRVLLAFNNHDQRAWEALLSASQGAGLRCTRASYQRPAVVPAKARFHPEGSYIGDIWAVFERSGTGWQPSQDLEAATAALKRAAAGEGDQSQQRRALAMAWLVGNIDAALIPSWHELLTE
jgi:transposase-like protein